MLALLASGLVVAYLVVPGLLFLLVVGLFVPLRVFDRSSTRAQLAYSVVVCAVPFCLAVALVQLSPLGKWPFGVANTAQTNGAADAKLVLLACYSDDFHGESGALWDAAVRATQRQGTTLFWYWLAVALEGALLGAVTANWGRIRRRLKGHPSLERWLASRLLPNVSEWHVLLTDFLFPGHTMHVDVLTTDDHLYQGDVLDYMMDRDGRLSGIYLRQAQRYKRAQLLSDRKDGVSKPKEQYWESIPGEHLYLFADRLASLNVRPRATPEETKEDLMPLAMLLGTELRGTVEVQVSPAARTGRSE